MRGICSFTYVSGRSVIIAETRTHALPHFQIVLHNENGQFSAFVAVDAAGFAVADGATGDTSGRLSELDFRVSGGEVTIAMS